MVKVEIFYRAEQNGHLLCYGPDAKFYLNLVIRNHHECALIMRKYVRKMNNE